MLADISLPRYPSWTSCRKRWKLGAYRDWRPTIVRTPLASASDAISSACAELAPRGHSQKTCLPASRAAMATS